MLLCSEEHAFAKLLENVKERVSGGNFEGAVITCTVSASIDSTLHVSSYRVCSTVCFSKASTTIFRAEVVRKIVVCF